VSSLIAGIHSYPSHPGYIHSSLSVVETRADSWTAHFSFVTGLGVYGRHGSFVFFGWSELPSSWGPTAT
jgi:zinc transporter ZupT